MPKTFDSYAPEGDPSFDAWWSEGNSFDSWVSEVHSFDARWSEGDPDGHRWRSKARWVPDEEWVPDEKWFDNYDKKEGSQGSKSGAQSSKDVWVNPDDVNKGTQTESGTSSKEAQVPATVDVKIEDTEDENQPAGTRKKKRR